MKVIICSVLNAFLFCNPAQAKAPSDLQLLFLKNHLAAGFGFPVMFTCHESQNGKGDFQLRTLPGFAVKFEYSYNFNEYVGITSGTRMGIKIFGYEADASSQDFTIKKDVKRRFTQTMPFFSIPFTINPRFFISGKNILQADFGGSVTFFMPGGMLSTMTYRDGNDIQRVFEMKLNYSDQPQFMMLAGLAYGRILKNENIVKIGISYEYGRKKALEGHYSFFDDDMKVGYGKIYSTLSAFEFEFSYVFTRASGIRKC